MSSFSFSFLFRRVMIGRFSIPVAAMIWFGVSLVAVLSKVLHGTQNNYLVYEGVFRHTLHQADLYAAYPAEHHDRNYYGPVFSLVIAPFAMLPRLAGCLLWCLANAGFLYWAIMRLPLSFAQRAGVVLLSLPELITSLQNVQFNPMLGAWILLAFVLVVREKEWAATLFIALGFLTKIYGIIALVSFLFSRHKGRFIGWFALWMGVLFCLPVLVSSPAFILQSYAGWFQALISKNELNAATVYTDSMQDISVAGMVRRISGNAGFSQLWVLVPAAVLYGLPLLRLGAYRSTLFQLLYAALSLIAVVIFSSSAESPTYIIAMLGVAIWFVVQPWPPARWAVVALVFALLLTSFPPTDLFPPFIRREYITRYSLKALPCMIVWLIIAGQLLRWPFREWGIGNRES